MSAPVNTVAVAQPVNAAALLQQCSQALGRPTPSLGLVAQGQRISSSQADPTRVTVKSLGGLSLRLEETTATGLEVRVAANGKGSVTRAGKKDALPSTATTYFHLDHIPVFLCESLPASWAVALKGVERVNSDNVYHLSIVAAPTASRTSRVDQALSSLDLYIDVTTHLPVKTKALIFSPTNLTNRSDWETYYGDYRDVQGLKIAFHTTQYLSGLKVNEFIFDTIVVQPVSVTEFQ